ncbi:hypothetical protein Pla163_34530 [Planctomycetes bacterium Pla163]|uniref:Outer membrane protein assembly factor BamD n=1 Tax=Rohdeia mirabilis TaxID=2528008 RepID=A0A518D496_9BACT|nr:hypothetical protein Pla163_34530 [Planctomycetes bacterium Pla163]
MDLRTVLSTSLLSFAAAASLLAGDATADTIRLASGETIDGIKIQEETLNIVAYSKGSTSREVPSDQVLSISYEEYPNLVKKAEEAAAEGDIFAAIESYDLYVEGQLANPNERKFKWAPAYAANRAVELNRAVGNYAAVVDAANRLLGNYAESRFVPSTYLAKAEAQRYTDDAAGAKATLDALAALVKSEKLSERYAFDVELALLEIDKGLSLGDRMKRVERLITQAGSKYPTVRRRAELLAGQTNVDEAKAASDAADVEAALVAAEKRFGTLLDSADSSDEVRAGSYVGLGDVYFFRANGEAEGLAKAGNEYLKVTVLYPGERRYLVRALYEGGRCFYELGRLNGSEVDQARAQRIFARLGNEFPDSNLTEKAKKLR